MFTAFSKEFLIAFGLILVALFSSMGGAIILALPLGLIGGFLLIKEMVSKVK